jgi:hypothetical protein
MNEKLDPKNINPRYMAYCLFYGITDPNKMLEKDIELYPGGKMLGFIQWIQENYLNFKKTIGRNSSDLISNDEQDKFTDYLFQLSKTKELV